VSEYLKSQTVYKNKYNKFKMINLIKGLFLFIFQVWQVNMERLMAYGLQRTGCPRSLLSISY